MYTDGRVTREHRGEHRTGEYNARETSEYNKRKGGSIRVRPERGRGLVWLLVRTQRKCGPFYGTVVLSLLAIANLQLFFVVFIFVILRHRLYMTRILLHNRSLRRRKRRPHSATWSLFVPSS